ncbi:hypothetical protein [Candidatus Thiodictyon syntrophicum]|jgi:hypothetical protein|nr:hypothetical protein [Candidatus Thiodictyon syntrophicum]
MHTRAPQLLTAGLLAVAATSAQAASLTQRSEQPDRIHHLQRDAGLAKRI